jgi:peroxiredoxin Q/BCP
MELRSKRKAATAAQAEEPVAKKPAPKKAAAKASASASSSTAAATSGATKKKGGAKAAAAKPEADGDEPEKPEDAPETEEKEAPAQEEEEKKEEEKDSEPARKEGPPSVGDTIDLDGFGGEIELNDGTKTTLKALVDESTNGVVLFTYPKASTPGCTNQACLFRDSYTPLTATGFSIFGLSTDSPKANTTFQQKQKLPYSLLCDIKATLIQAIGLKKAPKGTTRGVFVVDKQGVVLAREAGGPAATVEVVKALVSKE